MSLKKQPQAILVLPRLRVQNANAVSSPLTHGFPSPTSLVGAMWALERALKRIEVPLHFHGVGVVCHAHQEQVSGAGQLREPYTFHLSRNPVGQDGSTLAIVEEGRIHLDVTLVFTVSERQRPDCPSVLVDGAEALMSRLAIAVGEQFSAMRLAGGSLVPAQNAPTRRTQPWMAILPDVASSQVTAFRGWRRRWLPGFALVGRDDLLKSRHERQRLDDPKANLLDAWLDAARLNLRSGPQQDAGGPAGPDKVKWADPQRGPGSGWVVPLPVGYAALTALQPPGAVRNARDAGVAMLQVESVYSLGEWVSPHRLTHLDQLLWHSETDETLGLYRCRSGFSPDQPGAESPSRGSHDGLHEDGEDDLDDDAYVYS